MLVANTDLRTPAEPDRSVIGSGWGGDGWGSDDGSGDGWGWSDEPFGDEDERPYRRSRVVRAVALVTAFAVVAGSIGAWIAILTVGSPRPTFSVTSIRTTVPPAEQQRATTDPVATVSFVVANGSALAGRATCRVVVSTAHGVVGSASGTTPSLPAGASESVEMSVPLSSAALSGNGPAAARVSCLPAVPSRSQSA